MPLPGEQPESAYFLSVNRNKRAMSVDFKTERGLGILQRLVKQSDILVENFIPGENSKDSDMTVVLKLAGEGKLGKIGLGYEQCSVLNPKLIYASITG